MDKGLHHDEEPIVALASGQGASAIAILRVSGNDCHKLLLPCFRRKNPNKDWSANFQTLADFVHPQSEEVIDEVMLTLFRQPHSYTGQDSAEIFLHGSPYIIQSALKILYAQGFRSAEPGEFTRRAFLSGKIDLSEAEGINSLIASASHQQWLAARQLYTGKLKDYVDSLFRQLVEAIAWLEASIDFPEEDDTSQIQHSQILSRVRTVESTLRSLQKTYASGKVASQGLSVALFGEPNVGKSTLMNTLLGTERAIVTDIPGTTRDYLEEGCLINGRLIRLIDTAGVRTKAGTIEQMGIARTYELARQADLVLFLSDSLSPGALGKIETWKSEVQPRQAVCVLTKCDIQSPDGPLPTDWLKISCHTGEGLEALRLRIQMIADNFLDPLKEQTFLSSLRHKEAVDAALRTLENFFHAHSDRAHDEILAFELQQAAKSLRAIIGDIGSEDILDLVFSSFCVGK